MKIAFILILHLGLVACFNNATNSSLQCKRCQALGELKYYRILQDNATGGTFISMLDIYHMWGLLNKQEMDKLKKDIPTIHGQHGNLKPLASDTETIIDKGICDCFGGATKVCPKRNTNASTIHPAPPGGLNSSAGPVVVDKRAYSCLNCKAIDMIENYINSKGDDRDGTIFWALIDTITDQDVLNPKETKRLKRILTLEYVSPCRGYNYDRGGEEVIKYINQKSPYQCCKKLGPSKFLCTEGIPKLKKAILLIKDFIDLNHQCPKVLSDITFNFFVQDSITLQQWNSYDKLIKDQLKDRPKIVAELVLKDLKFNNAIKKLEDYKLEFNYDSNYDLQGTEILELMKEFKDEGLMSQSQYAQGLVDWQGKEINGDRLKMAKYVREKLIENHGY